MVPGHLTGCPGLTGQREAPGTELGRDWTREKRRRGILMGVEAEGPNPVRSRERGGVCGVRRHAAKGDH